MTNIVIWIICHCVFEMNVNIHISLAFNVIRHDNIRFVCLVLHRQTVTEHAYLNDVRLSNVNEQPSYSACILYLFTAVGVAFAFTVPSRLTRSGNYHLSL